MATISGPAPRPCESCPYRRDVPSGIWHADEYRKLPCYDRPTYDQPVGLFQCHQNGQDSDQARLCAGWVAVHGQELLALRLAIASGRVDPSAMDYTTPVPLFASGTEAAEHGLRDIDRPGTAAHDLMAKIADRRPDVLGDS